MGGTQGRMGGTYVQAGLVHDAEVALAAIAAEQGRLRVARPADVDVLAVDEGGHRSGAARVRNALSKRPPTPRRAGKPGQNKQRSRRGRERVGCVHEPATLRCWYW